MTARTEPEVRGRRRAHARRGWLVAAVLAALCTCPAARPEHSGRGLNWYVAHARKKLAADGEEKTR